MTVAARARQAALQVEAKKDSLRQHQDGTWKVTFTVSPTDMPAALLSAPPGTRYVVALVEVDGNEMPVQRAPRAVQKPSRRWDELSLPEQAGIRCQEARFAEFLGVPLDKAAEELRRRLGVQSRGHLNTNPDAAERWKALDGQYQLWLRYGDAA